MKHLLLLVGASLFLPAQNTIMVTRLDFTVNYVHVTGPGKLSSETGSAIWYIAPDGRERHENYDAEGHLRQVLLIDPAKGSSIELHPNSKVGRSRKPPLRSTGPMQAPRRKLATSKDSIAGLDCVKTESQPTPAGPIEASTCKDPVTGRRFLAAYTIQWPGGSITQQKLTRLQHNVPVDPSIFEVPADYTIH